MSLQEKDLSSNSIESIVGAMFIIISFTLGLVATIILTFLKKWQKSPGCPKDSGQEGSASLERLVWGKEDSGGSVEGVVGRVDCGGPRA